MIKGRLNSVLLTALALQVAACGEGVVDISNQPYEPKIVIEGILIPQAPVTNIKIGRNFPLNTQINPDEIRLPDADAKIMDASGVTYDLTFNPDSHYYEYLGTDLVIDYGKSYTLEVTAMIDGRELSATSTTTVPQAGFEIMESSSILGSMGYRERDENGVIINFEVAFNRSPNTNFYTLSLVALDASIESFIYDNPFCDCNENDVDKEFYHFRAIVTWIQDTPLEAGESTIEIFSFFTWFYGEYQVVVYAGDRNFKDFLVTHERVQEIDGNFHEPAFHIEGDGIGVFGSAIADTTYFTIVQE